MKVLCALLLVVAGCSLPALALNATEVAAIEQELVNASFVSTPLEFSNRQTRGFGNPLPWIKEQVKNNCKCAKLTCECCFKFNWMAYEGCMSVEHMTKSKAVRLKLGFNAQTLLTEDVGLARTFRQCGNLPAPLEFASYCLSEKTDQKNDGTITGCPALELRMLSQTGASIQFACLEFKKGALTIGGMPSPDESAIVNLQVKEPFKKAMQAYANFRKSKRD